MSLVSPTLPSPGDAANASDISTPINQLATVINGGLDDTNISSLSGSKIASGTLPTAALEKPHHITRYMSTSGASGGAVLSSGVHQDIPFTTSANTTSLTMSGQSVTIIRDGLYALSMTLRCADVPATYYPYLRITISGNSSDVGSRPGQALIVGDLITAHATVWLPAGATVTPRSYVSAGTRIAASAVSSIQYETAFTVTEIR